MFGPFKSAHFSDPVPGQLVRSRGFWRGKLQRNPGPIKLALAGTHAAPDPAAVAIARELEAQLRAWRCCIETALFEHYEPYAESVPDGEFPEASEPFPSIPVPADVWPHVSLEFISVFPLGGVLTTELGYTAAWHEEHTLGVRFAGDTFLELCGSVLPP